MDLSGICERDQLKTFHASDSEEQQRKKPGCPESPVSAQSWLHQLTRLLQANPPAPSPPTRVHFTDCKGDLSVQGQQPQNWHMVVREGL